MLITVQTDEPNIKQMARFISTGMIPNSLDCVHYQIHIFRLIASETHIFTNYKTWQYVNGQWIL